MASGNRRRRRRLELYNGREGHGFASSQKLGKLGFRLLGIFALLFLSDGDVNKRGGGLVTSWGCAAPVARPRANRRKTTSIEWRCHGNPRKSQRNVAATVRGGGGRGDDGDGRKQWRLFPSWKVEAGSTALLAEPKETECAAINSEVEEAQAVIRNFLSKPTSTKSAPRFYIQGWRWHTMALIRDVKQLHRLVQQQSKENVPRLKKATEFCIQFNMAALHKIETQTFFPWLEETLVSCKSLEVKDESLQKSFGVILDYINEERKAISQMGDEVLRQVKASSSSKAPIPSSLESLLHGLVSKTRQVQVCQEEYLVPSVAALVSPSQQKSLNSRVLRNLGLANSRIHLVAMYDAIHNDENDENDGKNNSEEAALFVENIPYVARIMISRWRRLLYEPMGGAALYGSMQEDDL